LKHIYTQLSLVSNTQHPGLRTARWWQV